MTAMDGRSRSRIAVGSIAALILLVPLVVMQFSDEMAWDLFDFVVFGLLLAVAAVLYELATKKAGNSSYRWAAGVALTGAFLLVWVNGAVGIIGSEGNDANLMYFGVLAAGIVGGVLSRFRPRGMAMALFAVAVAQLLVAVVALVGGFGSAGPVWPWDIVGATLFFIVLWLTSAFLFRRAASTE